ncbi:MAG: hypothetical protein FWD18_08410 [Micrococcales bacterium]|nr:hypothetical protein [Micrococcales bacterium]
MRRVVARRGALVLALGLVASMVCVQPAAADDAPDGAVELSADGTVWSQDLVADLFSPPMVWVPGDVGTATLYVRSRACVEAVVLAEVTIGSDVQLADDLGVRTRTDGGPWAGSSSPSFTVAAGQVARLDVEVTYDPASSNDSQTLSLPLTVVVTVACDRTVVVPPGPGGRDGGAGGSLAPPQAPSSSAASPVVSRVLGLAGTGVALADGVVAVVMIVLAGAGLLSWRRGKAPDA